MKKGIIIVSILLLAGCKTVRYVPVVAYHTDTLTVTKHERDSIHVHDSIVEQRAGDTVRIEKWHVRYIERQVHDTLYQVRRDSIPYPVEVTKEVPCKLSSWQQIRMRFGSLCMLLLGMWIVYKLRKFIPK